jgi:hypothetical protein
VALFRDSIGGHVSKWKEMISFPLDGKTAESAHYFAGYDVQ